MEERQENLQKLMEYKFDNEFRFKDLPDESTPHNAENMNKALENTSWLKQQLDGTIEPMSGSSIEINDSAEAMLNKLEIEGKSTQDGEPSPYYPSEIKSVGYENLFDSERFYNEYKNTYSSSIETVEDNNINYYKINYSPTAVRNYQFMKDEFKNNTQYTLKFKAKNAETGIAAAAGFWIKYKEDDSSTSIIVNSDDEKEYSVVSSKDKTIDYICLSGSGGHLFLARNIFLYEGSEEKTYISYGKYGLELIISKDDNFKTTTFVLNEPLRSLPNETKDLLYFKNGHLYVKRNIKELILNGTENFFLGAENVFWLHIKDMFNPLLVHQKIITSNSFISQNSTTSISTWRDYDMNVIAVRYVGETEYPVGIKTDVTDTLNNFKIWLSEQNEKGTPVIIQYQLAQPTTEDLGEIEMPSTFKDKSTITTTDELEPTINLEYVKDTILTNYVEKRLINLMK